jgi:putative tryptophan/tyrosine transport system substrate-binding protein
MRRRDVIALVGALPIVLPVGGRAQPTDRVRRIGYLTGATGSPEDALGVRETRALIDGLRELGWVDGRNITIEHRFSGSGRKRIATAARELVALAPDLIISTGGPRLAALLAATRTVPIVFTMVADPVGSGFVASLANPGGNATGIAVGEAPIAGKWLEFLKQIDPPLTRALVLMEADSPPQLLYRDAAMAAGPSLGVTVAIASIREAGDYDREIDAFAREPGGGLVVLANPTMGINQERIYALAARYRLPAVYGYPIFAESGGLIAYGPDPFAMFREATRYADKILHGAQPGDLPVQQPTRFVLAVNLKTAKALGLAVPPSILIRADEVIE